MKQELYCHRSPTGFHQVGSINAVGRADLGYPDASGASGTWLAIVCRRCGAVATGFLSDREVTWNLKEASSGGNGT